MPSARSRPYLPSRRRNYLPIPPHTHFGPCPKPVSPFPQTYFVPCSPAPNFAPGEMAERSIAAVLKTVEGQTSGGSNPSLSAHIQAKPFTDLHYRLNARFKVQIRCKKKTRCRNSGPLLNSNFNCQKLY